MKEYKAQETRIKVVTQGNEIKYYPQYKLVIIPHIWWEWYPCMNDIADQEFTRYLSEAKRTIDIWLTRQVIMYYEDLEISKIKSSKRTVTYINYP